MRKVLTVFLTVILCVSCFFGCKKKQTIYSVDPAFATYELYDEYIYDMEEMKEKGIITDKVFVYPRSQPMGEFKVFSTVGGFQFYEQYGFDEFARYTFIAENDAKFYLTFWGYWFDERDENDTNEIGYEMYKDEYREKRKGEYYIKKYSPENTDDMRYFGKDITGEYVYKNLISYDYRGGKLVNVRWIQNNDVLVVLSSEEFHIYPLYTDTFQSKILNLDTAVEAVCELFGEPTPLKAFFEE